MPGEQVALWPEVGSAAQGHQAAPATFLFLGGGFGCYSSKEHCQEAAARDEALDVDELVGAVQVAAADTQRVECGQARGLENVAVAHTTGRCERQ